ncbi:hypothetical protein BU15DRAFT_45153 [Melanogaster broomeanus]|nr:hypothetical protein BU15DRAFT_45153 [Melanogaster broomeanus]
MPNIHNTHDFYKEVHKAGTGRTDEGQTFKKPFQTVRHPPTLHNIHDDYVSHPPRNVPQGEDTGRASNLGKKWGAREKEPLQMGVLGYEDTGRIKPVDAQGQIVQESSVHP